MRRPSVYILFFVLALVACGGCGKAPEDAHHPSDFTTSASASGSADASDVPTEPGSTSVPDESDHPHDGDTGGGNGGNGGGGGNGGKDDDDRVIELGGPTLDNTYPTNPFALPKANMSTCVLFTNSKADVPVTIESVRLVDLHPHGAPGLVLGDSPSTHYQCTPNSPAYPDGLEKVFDDCTNASLAPHERTACPLEVGSIGRDGIDYTATLLLHLSAVCSSASGDPCVRLPSDVKPSPGSPVTIHWTDIRRYTSCLAPHDRGGGEFSAEEGQGRCPPVRPSQSPGSNGSADPDPGGTGPNGDPSASDSASDGNG